MPTAAMPEAVLFDLDGTLIDSAPDLLAALDHVRAGLDLPPGDHQRLREHVSRGAAGILGAGLEGWADRPEAERDRLREQLLDFYATHCWTHSSPFHGIEELLEKLSGQGVRLGIVTNKISRFAEPVVAHAGWADRFGCLVTGDRVVRPKPDPEPVLAACQALGARPDRVVFVGDDRRDVEAGAAAGTRTVVAAWGYLPAGERPEAWRADAVIDHPAELLGLFGTRRAG
ncbi:HAD family hydrolase [Wenzhouxiangella sediminis]|uniref:HAD family hydrolase n=1 Tax=Wenzhouxiangella sediminis TaxID=1792836 RepID=A0A3E1KBB5_9GAMM|nr:HAD-IA family hydrolase [Wenzhouxiangella sediminis]RFF31901.1 HAD family hydrolase [Wenzhouxiangella sediminis]